MRCLEKSGRSSESDEEGRPDEGPWSRDELDSSRRVSGDARDGRRGSGGSGVDGGSCAGEETKGNRKRQEAQHNSATSRRDETRRARID
jgi:hypothetical protein